MEFIRAHAKGNARGGKAKADISIYGQESNDTTWRLAKMNLAFRRIHSSRRLANFWKYKLDNLAALNDGLPLAA